MFPLYLPLEGIPLNHMRTAVTSQMSDKFNLLGIGIHFVTSYTKSESEMFIAQLQLKM